MRVRDQVAGVRARRGPGHGPAPRPPRGGQKPPRGRGGGAAGGGCVLAGLGGGAPPVDGTLTVRSPAGGPTVVTILLPLAGSR